MKWAFFREKVSLTEIARLKNSDEMGVFFIISSLPYDNPMATCRKLR